MTYHPERPLIVQGDHSLLLETHNPQFNAARDAISPFAELEKSPEHIHSYRLNPLSLWNAAAAGHTLTEAEAALHDYQHKAVESFVASGSHGVIVLACGSGKTIVGMATMARIGMTTLIVTPITAAAHQWHAELLGAPVITGRMSSAERERLHAAFRAGDIRLLVVSKVANYAIDLPDASLPSRFPEALVPDRKKAQRLGRILRPKGGPAYFYTLVSDDSEELKFAANRQRFLAEQGYDYLIEDWAA